MPTASIVIPCYNAERFVEQTLASAQAQTVRDVQIICVDDGSADGTLELLRRAAAADSRVRVLAQDNAGEGPARDAGLAQATGTWVYFLDADDLMEPTLLEEAIGCAEREDADVVVFRTTMLDDQTGERRPCDWAFKRDWMPDDAFDPREHPDHIFNSFQNWVHNKLFRGSFLREHGLHMQHVQRTADLLFTCRALAEARRIALLDKPLYLYRVNNAQSAMSTSDQHPLDFYQAFVALRSALEEAGLWELYHDSFVNWAIEGIAVNLRFSRDYATFRTIADELCAGGFEALDITDFPRDKSDMPFYYDQIRPLVEGSAERTLFGIVKSYRDEHGGAEADASRSRVRMAELEEAMRRAKEELACERARAADEIDERERRIAELEAQLGQAREDLACVTSSASFRVGRAATAVPRKLRDLASQRRAHRG